LADKPFFMDICLIACQAAAAISGADVRELFRPRGQGQLMLGAEFRWDEAKNQIIIENFSFEPIHLTQVRMR
jgi:hypothetical protein